MSPAQSRPSSSQSIIASPPELVLPAPASCTPAPARCSDTPRPFVNLAATRGSAEGLSPSAAAAATSPAHHGSRALLRLARCDETDLNPRTPHHRLLDLGTCHAHLSPALLVGLTTVPRPTLAVGHRRGACIGVQRGHAGFLFSETMNVIRLRGRVVPLWRRLEWACGGVPAPAPARLSRTPFPTECGVGSTCLYTYAQPFCRFDMLAQPF